MGGGSYSVTSRSLRSESMGYATKSAHEIFQSRKIEKEFDPVGVTLRESRDSDEHPNSLAIFLALDVTGSMGHIPYSLIKDGLPKIMGNIIQRGIKDPQLLIAAIGDHECDRSPLQVGQFESSDEKIDNQLEKLYIESGGGGNDGESYLLAWFFAGNYTAIDCQEKRNQKGFLFTIGDEPTLKNVPGTSLNKIMGNSQNNDETAMELLKKARDKYNVYHIHVKEGLNGTREDVIGGWKQLMGDSLIIIDDYREIPVKIASIVTNGKTTVSKENFSETSAEQEEEAAL